MRLGRTSVATLPFSADFDALARGDRYTLVRTFGDGRLLLFRGRPGHVTTLEGSPA